MSFNRQSPIHPVLRACSAIVQILLACSWAHAGEWVSETERDAPESKLCQALNKHLNDSVEGCVHYVLQSYPQFSDPPWHTLNPHEHLELLTQLIAYKNGTPTQAIPDFAPFRPRALDFINRGGQMRVWRTHLISNFGSETKDEAPSGEQAVVQLLEPVDSIYMSGKCSDNVPVRFIPYTFIALPDLSSIDKRVSAPVADNLLPMAVMLHAGQPIMIKTIVDYLDNSHLMDGSVSAWTDLPRVGLRQACNFRFRSGKAHTKKVK